VRKRLHRAEPENRHNQTSEPAEPQIQWHGEKASRVGTPLHSDVAQSDSHSRTEDQDNVDKENHQVHGPFEHGCTRSGERERAEHERESEKGHASRVEA
jgi:hypothetical protein